MIHQVYAKRNKWTIFVLLQRSGLYRDSAITDSGIQNLAGADARGNGEATKLKDPKTKTLVTVNANYAIKNILPGDTVKVLNMPSGSSSLLSGQVLRIQGVEYDGNLAVLHLADQVNVFGNEIMERLG